MKLNIGCGKNYLDGFVNIDTYEGVKKDMVGDIKQIPLDDGSCEFIACNHVLEHLKFEEIDIAFRELKRVLAKGGKIRLSMPNIKEAIKKPLEKRNVDVFGYNRWEGDIHYSAFRPEDIFYFGETYGFNVEVVDKKDWFDKRHNDNSNMEFELK